MNSAGRLMRRVRGAFVAAAGAACVGCGGLVGCALGGERVDGVPEVVGIWEAIAFPEPLAGRGVEIDLVVSDDGDWVSRFVGPGEEVMYEGEGLWFDRDGGGYVLTTERSGGGRAIARVAGGGDRLRVETEQGEIVYRRATGGGGGLGR